MVGGNKIHCHEGGNMNAFALQRNVENFSMRLDARAAMLEMISDQVEQEDAQILLHRLTEDLKKDRHDFDRDILRGVYEE
jgi:hypothetical protein